MTVMQMRSGQHLWQPIWDISMQPGRFYTVTVSGKKVIIVLGCISNPTRNGDYWKMSGSSNSITCGDYGRTIGTAWMPARPFRNPAICREKVREIYRTDGTPGQGSAIILPVLSLLPSRKILAFLTRDHTLKVSGKCTSQCPFMYRQLPTPPIPVIIPPKGSRVRLLCQGLPARSFRDGHLAPGFPLHAPGKLFRIPEVFGIGSALVQTSKEPEKTVRVPPRTPEFPDNRVPFRLELFPDLLVILFDEFPVCNEGRGPVG